MPQTKKPESQKKTTKSTKTGKRVTSKSTQCGGMPGLLDYKNSILSSTPIFVANPTNGSYSLANTSISAMPLMTKTVTFGQVSSKPAPYNFSSVQTGGCGCMSETVKGGAKKKKVNRQNKK
jgi:hypothetical protein